MSGGVKGDTQSTSYIRGRNVHHKKALELLDTFFNSIPLWQVYIYIYT